MLNWIRRLLRSRRGVRAGGDSAASALTARASPPARPAPSLPTRPAANPEERRALEAASLWLDAATLAHARAFALGEERRFEFDQDTGRLSLIFADGAALALDAQILGSFRPQDWSFRWAWANRGVAPELTTAAQAARDHPEAAAFAALGQPTFQATYDDSRRLAALGARLGGCDGAYRCITTDHLSVFVGFAAPRVDREDWFGGPGPGAAAEAALEAEAKAVVDAWDEAMFPIDQAWAEAGQPGDADALDHFIGRKQAVYQRCWRRPDEAWIPGSLGWPSPHDPSRRAWRATAPRRAGGVYVLSSERLRRDAHVVEWSFGVPRITDLDLDWGRGLMLS